MTDTQEISSIFDNWTLENFKSLFKVTMGINMPIILSNFIYGYTSLLENKSKFQDIGYGHSMSFKSYQDNMPRFYASNIEKVVLIDSNFESVFQVNKNFALKELKQEMQDNMKFIQFLKSLETTRLCIFKAGMLPIIGYLAKRFFSYYEKNSFVNLEYAEKGLEKVLREAHQSEKCIFSYDMGWVDTSEWLSMADCGKYQFSPEYATMAKALYFADFVRTVMEQKSYQRNIKALAIIECAAEDFTVILDKVEANLLFMKNIEGTSLFKEVVDSYRSWSSAQK